MGKPGKKAHRLKISNGSLFEDQLAEEGSAITALPTFFDPDEPERSYIKLIPLEHRKRFAQFFTPQPIAQLMIDWVNVLAPKTVLDPALGTGIFLRLMAQSNPSASLLGVEVDPVAYGAACSALAKHNADIVLHDFLTWQSDQTFEGIVSNPPYLRHHDINYVCDIHTEIGSKNGVVLSKLANIYVLFILEICRRLTLGGRAAIIVPSEWSNSNFGMSLKNFLLENGLLRKLIYFSNLSEQFPDALTTAAILLIEKPNKGEAKHDYFESSFVEHGAHIDDLRQAILSGGTNINGIVQRTFQNTVLKKLEKWDKVLRDGLTEQVAGFIPLGELAVSKRGIATGANEFFHLSDSSARTLRLRKSNLKPCVGRAEDVLGLKFTTCDWDRIQQKDSRVWLLSFQDIPNAEEQAYINLGEKNKLDERFLLANRKPWYSMERRLPAPIWAAVFSRTSLRFIYNEAGVSNLTTFHCIYPKSTDPLFCKALVACLNSKRVQKLAEHQRRVYGGGLMKFEPKDLLAIQIPLLLAAPQDLVELLAAMLDRLDDQVRQNGQISAGLAEELDKLVILAASSGKQDSRNFLGVEC